jgi:hypothetical protein
MRILIFSYSRFCASNFHSLWLRRPQELGSVEQVNAWLERIAEFCRSGQIDANDLVHFAAIGRTGIVH